MTHIVVLGAGLGGITQAYELKQALPAKARITVVSDLPYFEFTPSNPWVAVGWREPSDIRVDLAGALGRNGVDFIGKAAAKVHPEHNRIELADGESVDYDYLVIATGPALAFDEIPGLGPHGGHTQSVCKTDHARQAMDDFEKLVADPGPVVVGAAQGASCFGPAYEYAFILETELRRRKIRDRVPMTFVTPEPYIGHLGLDGVGDTKSMLESELRGRHIRWVTNARIDEVSAGRVRVSEMASADEVAKEHELEFRHSMILPAFRGVDAVRDVEGLVNLRGFVLIDDYQRNPAYPNVYSIGVCVAIPPVGPTTVPLGTPKTGYMIESMAAASAHNIAAAMAGKEPSHRASWNAVCLADFGDRGVAFVALPQIPPRNTNWSGEGKWVHLAKVGFEKYFLRKVRRGQTEPVYERLVMRLLGVDKLRQPS